MSIHIRPANHHDLDLLARLNHCIQELHVASKPDHFKQVDLFTIAGWFESMLHDAEVRIWLADLDGVGAGYALTITRERPDNVFCTARRFYEIDQLGVDPEFRRRGVARALVEHVLADARSHGVSDVELTSWSFNTAAHAAFRALGFEPKILRFSRRSST